MKSYILNIAGYRIKLEAALDGPELEPSARFLKFISDREAYDFILRVHKGNFDIPGNSQKVFSAPYVEEVNGIRLKKSDNFWSVFRNEKDLFITTDFPLSVEKKSAVLQFSLSSKEWNLWIDSAFKQADPLEYPLDGLVLYYLTVINRDIMIHASGINHSGKGYLFSGVSGKGKTTMARLWSEHGAKVIHDDRLIIRKEGNRFTMFNTPVYNNDEPSVSPVDGIFIIEHGESDKLLPAESSNAVSLLVANCIQHNWNPEIIKDLLGSVDSLCDIVPVKVLYFRPENSIIGFLLKNDKR